MKQSKMLKYIDKDLELTINSKKDEEISITFTLADLKGSALYKSLIVYCRNKEKRYGVSR